MELPRKITPENRPIQCSKLSDAPTIVPAMWRDGARRNAVGASTNEKKMIPPTQMTKDRNMRKRRKDMAVNYKTDPHSPGAVKAVIVDALRCSI